MLSKLEPSGLFRSDERRPDGVSLTPWRVGKLLAWAATCFDLFALSYRSLATHSPGLLQKAETLKSEKYKDLPRDYMFISIATETSGVFGPHTLQFIKYLGRQIVNEQESLNLHCMIIQRLAVAIQRGNSVSIFGTHG